MRVAITCTDYVGRLRCYGQIGVRRIELVTAYTKVLVALPKGDTLIVNPECQK